MAAAFAIWLGLAPGCATVPLPANCSGDGTYVVCEARFKEECDKARAQVLADNARRYYPIQSITCNDVRDAKSAGQYNKPRAQVEAEDAGLTEPTADQIAAGGLTPTHTRFHECKGKVLDARKASQETDGSRIAANNALHAWRTAQGQCQDFWSARVAAEYAQAERAHADYLHSECVALSAWFRTQDGSTKLKELELRAGDAKWVCSSRAEDGEALTTIQGTLARARQADDARKLAEKATADAAALAKRRRYEAIGLRVGCDPDNELMFQFVVQVKMGALDGRRFEKCVFTLVAMQVVTTTRDGWTIVRLPGDAQNEVAMAAVHLGGSPLADGALIMEPIDVKYIGVRGFGTVLGTLANIPAFESVRPR